jgi:hypothetical protein
LELRSLGRRQGQQAQLCEREDKKQFQQLVRLFEVESLWWGSCLSLEEIPQQVRFDLSQPSRQSISDQQGAHEIERQMKT